MKILVTGEGDQPAYSVLACPVWASLGIEPIADCRSDS